MSPARKRNWIACDALAAPNGADCGARTRNRRRRPLLDLEFAVYREGLQVLRSSTRWSWHTIKACMHLRFAPSPRIRRHKYSILLDADKPFARTHICPAPERNFEVVPSAIIDLARTVGIGYRRILVGRSLMSPTTVAPSTALSLRTAQTLIDCGFTTRPAAHRARGRGSLIADDVGTFVPCSRREIRWRGLGLQYGIGTTWSSHAQRSCIADTKSRWSPASISRSLQRHYFCFVPE